MKKFLASLLAAALVLTIASCGDQTTPSGEDTSPGDDTSTTGGEDTLPAPVYDTYTVTLDSGVVIEIGGAADDTVSKLGDYIDYMEAPSCVHEGDDKVYTYDGYTVTTSPAADGSEYVAELALTSDVVALDNGVYIGCTLDDVKAAYGDDYEESFGVYKYTTNPGATISVIIDGDAVTAITISSTIA